ncbi:hypothetical protein ACFL1Q_00245 [Patescibacteria group bacterium]
MHKEGESIYHKSVNLLLIASLGLASCDTKNPSSEQAPPQIDPPTVEPTLLPTEAPTTEPTMVPTVSAGKYYEASGGPYNQNQLSLIENDFAFDQIKSYNDFLSYWSGDGKIKVGNTPFDPISADLHTVYYFDPENPGSALVCLQANMEGQQKKFLPPIINGEFATVPPTTYVDENGVVYSKDEILSSRTLLEKTWYIGVGNGPLEISDFAYINGKVIKVSQEGNITQVLNMETAQWEEYQLQTGDVVTERFIGENGITEYMLGGTITELNFNNTTYKFIVNQEGTKTGIYLNNEGEWGEYLDIDLVSAKMFVEKDMLVDKLPTITVEDIESGRVTNREKFEIETNNVYTFPDIEILHNSGEKYHGFKAGNEMYAHIYVNGYSYEARKQFNIIPPQAFLFLYQVKIDEKAPVVMSTQIIIQREPEVPYILFHLFDRARIGKYGTVNQISDFYKSIAKDKGHFPVTIYFSKIPGLDYTFFNDGRYSNNEDTNEIAGQTAYLLIRYLDEIKKNYTASAETAKQIERTTLLRGPSWFKKLSYKQ